jgi:hypothetical protein
VHSVAVEDARGLDVLAPQVRAGRRSGVQGAVEPLDLVPALRGALAVDDGDQVQIAHAGDVVAGRQ